MTPPARRGRGRAGAPAGAQGLTELEPRIAAAIVPAVAAELVAWQRRHGRHALPWQASRDPYRVWLSEVMLQQTQVATVLGYYERFLARFPDVAALAAAPLDEVLGLWSGLGYYSRARNLHRCAQAVVATHGGRFPPDAARLAELPGIGPSTAAAIAAFCFGQRVAILDGNVQRVLARLLAWDEDLAGSAGVRRLWAIATRLLPADAAELPPYTQGLMDLGATVCTPRTPRCEACPWMARCQAREQGEPLRYPVKLKRLKRGRRESWCLWLQCGDWTWLQQRPDTGVWAGLWAWPMFDTPQARDAALAQLFPDGAAPAWPATSATLQDLPSFVHVLTHLDWTLRPARVDLAAPIPVVGEGEDETAGPVPGADQADLAAALATLGEGRWFHRARLATLGLPAPLRKALLG